MQLKRPLIILLAFFSLLSGASAMLLRGGGHVTASSFVSAWKTILTSGGGAVAILHTYSDGTIVGSGDTFGPWVYCPSGTTTLDGTTYTCPAFAPVATTDSLPAGDISFTSMASGNVTAVDLVAAPTNTNVMYMWYNTKVYASTNRGVTWTSTDLTVPGYNPNGTTRQTSWMAVDPGNSNVVYLVLPNNTYTDHLGAHTGTLLVNTTGPSCSSSCWSVVAGIPVPSGSGACGVDLTPCGGNVIFDQTSTFTGGRTQTIYVGIPGTTGIVRSTNGGTSFAQVNTGSPPTNIFQMTVDSFGQLWAVEGFHTASPSKIYKFASSTWTNITIGGSLNFTSVLQDPNSASLGANHMIALDIDGQIIATLNNGTDLWANTIGRPSQTIGASGAQAPWLNNVNQYSSGTTNPALSAGIYAYDASGKLWAGTGIDFFTTSNPIVGGVLQSTAAWTANTLGVNQLVNNMILSPPGVGPISVNWDRGVITQVNPDVLATLQYTNKNTSGSPPIIVGGWGVDYVPGTPTTIVAGLGDGGAYSNIAVSTDGGNVFAPTAAKPAAGVTNGITVATSTTTNWCVIPGDQAGQNTIVSCTTNGGGAWTTGSFTGSPTSFIGLNAGHFNNRQPLTADRVTAGTFYVVDQNQKFFSSTNNGANWAATGATSASVDGSVQSDRLMAAPKLGTTSTAGHVYYLSETGHLWKSTNGAVSFTSVSSTLDKLSLVGFGAPLPGQGYPAIYVYQISGGTAAQGYYYSTDAGVTWNILNVPASEQVYASHVLDFNIWLSGDGSIYGRLYVGVLGSGPGYYIDTADACPWINFSNTNPNASLTGTVSLQAQVSGKIVPTSVNFYVDGSLIGNQTSGSGTPTVYTQSWVTGGVGAGSHTLKVETIGNGCTAGGGGNSMSIPITTH